MGCPHTSSIYTSWWALQEHQHCVIDRSIHNNRRLTTIHNHRHYRRLYRTAVGRLQCAICRGARMSIYLCSNLRLDLGRWSSDGYCSTVGRGIFCRLFGAIGRLFCRHGRRGRRGWYDAVGLYAGGHRALRFGVGRDDGRRNRSSAGSGSHCDCVMETAEAGAGRCRTGVATWYTGGLVIPPLTRTRRAGGGSVAFV